MEPVNPVLLGEGRWLVGDASARASEETGVQSDLVRTLRATFQLSQNLFFWAGRLHVLTWVAVLLARWCTLHLWKSWYR